MIQLRSGSLFTVNDLSRKQTKLSMPIGKAKFKVDPRRKLMRRFQVRTTTAIVGVRGTEFVMGAGEGQTSMLTLSGAVEMASVEAPAVKVQVNIGQASKLVVGKAPTPPFSVPPELRASIAEGDSTESFEVVSFLRLKTLRRPLQNKSRSRTRKMNRNKTPKKRTTPRKNALMRLPRKTTRFLKMRSRRWEIPLWMDLQSKLRNWRSRRKSRSTLENWTRSMTCLKR